MAVVILALAGLGLGLYFGLRKNPQPQSQPQSNGTTTPQSQPQTQKTPPPLYDCSSSSLCGSVKADTLKFIRESFAKPGEVEALLVFSGEVARALPDAPDVARYPDYYAALFEQAECLRYRFGDRAPEVMGALVTSLATSSDKLLGFLQIEKSRNSKVLPRRADFELEAKCKTPY